MYTHTTFERRGACYFLTFEQVGGKIHIQRNRSKREKLTTDSKDWQILPPMWQEYCLAFWDKHLPLKEEQLWKGYYWQP